MCSETLPQSYFAFLITVSRREELVAVKPARVFIRIRKNCCAAFVRLADASSSALHTTQSTYSARDVLAGKPGTFPLVQNRMSAKFAALRKAGFMDKKSDINFL
jgi:hypothetical protein